LRSAQILFFGDGRANEVRINSEVKGVFTAKKKKGITKKEGDPVYEHDLLGITKIKLIDGGRKGISKIISAGEFKTGENYSVH